MGYSWESDAIVFMNFFSIVNLFINCANDDAYRLEFQNFIEKFTLKLARLCAIDVRYFDAPIALFDRNKPQSILTNDFSKRPNLNIKKILQSASSIIYKPEVEIVYPKNPWLSFFGKSVSKIVYHWFSHKFHKEKLARKVHYDTFLAHVASSFIMNDNEPQLYYREKIENFISFQRMK